MIRRKYIYLFALVLMCSCGSLSEWAPVYNSVVHSANRGIEQETGEKRDAAFLGVAGNNTEARALAEKNGYPYYKLVGGSVYGYTTNPN